MPPPDRSDDSVQDLLSAIIDAHALYPDLRIGQLLLNVLDAESAEARDARLYFIENRDLIRELRKITAGHVRV